MNPLPRLVRFFALALALPVVLLVACSGEATPRPIPAAGDSPSPSLLPAIASTAQPEPDPIVNRIANRSPTDPEPVIDPDEPATDTGEVTVDNRIRDAEWAAAGSYTFDDQPLLRGVKYLFDSTTLYVRIDFAREVLGDEGAGFDLYVGGDSKHGDSATALRAPLGFGAAASISWRGTAPIEAVLRTPSPTTVWALDGAPLATGFDGSSVEVAVPLVLIVNPLGGATRLPFRVLDRTAGLEQAMVPVVGPGYFQLPEPAWGRQIS